MQPTENREEGFSIDLEKMGDFGHTIFPFIHHDNGEQIKLQQRNAQFIGADIPDHQVRNLFKVQSLNNRLIGYKKNLNKVTVFSFSRDLTEFSYKLIAKIDISQCYNDPRDFDKDFIHTAYLRKSDKYVAYLACIESSTGRSWSIN